MSRQLALGAQYGFDAARKPGKWKLGQIESVLITNLLKVIVVSQAQAEIKRAVQSRECVPA